MEKQEDLIGLVIEALGVSKKVRLLERCGGVKYDESAEINVREDLRDKNGFSVGDTVDRRASVGTFVIAGFVEMSAKISRGIKRKNVFCALAIPSPPKGPPLTPHRRIIRARATEPSGPVLLFRLEELRKFQK